MFTILMELLISNALNTEHRQNTPDFVTDLEGGNEKL